MDMRLREHVAPIVEDVKTQFRDELARSIVLIIVVLTLSALVLMGRDIPAWYAGAASGIIFYYFGSRGNGKNGNGGNSIK